MAITQTKKKGQGCETLEDRFTLLYSSKPENQRVVCLIHKENFKVQLQTGSLRMRD